MNSAIDHLDFLIDNTHITLNYMNGKKMKQQQFFALILLERLRYGCYTIRKLYPDLIDEHELRLSVGLTIRALIVDYLIAMNMNTIFYDNQDVDDAEEVINDKTEEFSNLMLADGLKQAINYLDNRKIFDLRNTDQVYDVFNAMASRFQHFFEPSNNAQQKPKVKFPNAPGVKELFERLAKRSDLKDSSEIYDSYVFFSKWDHFGILYYDTIHLPNELLMKMIDKCIREFTFYQALPHGILYDFSEEDEFLKRQYDASSEYWKSAFKP